MLMIIGSDMVYCKNTGSTNSYASGLIKAGQVSEGTVVYTNFQSAGRGQKSNRWESEDGKNLLFSVILYPSMVSPLDQFIISIFISIGICDFLKTLVPGCQIKWPNDIYHGDDKIAGILIENSITGNAIVNSIAGIGLNINQEEFPEEIPNPVSLKMLTGVEHDTGLCLQKLAACLDKRYKQVISGEWDELRNEYISSLYRINLWSRFKSADGIFEGRILSVTEAGCLQIEKKPGKKLEFAFKEIEFEI
jgi:BirA family transcriptional regulator, biotin operon repressor / biotin---[acetyl-CoA-carboxylase] ligase